MLTALIITNLSIAILGAFLNFLRSVFAGVDASDRQAAVSGVIGTIVSLVVFWQFFTYNVSVGLLLSYTWPSLLLGAMFGLLVRRILK